MVNKKALSFEQICPFVRHVHLSCIQSDIHLQLVKSFDYRLLYIYSGTGYILINGVKYFVSKGNLFLWQPGTEYLIFSNVQDHLMIIGVNFDFTTSKSNLNLPIAPEKSEEFDDDRIIECVAFTDAVMFNEPIYLKNLQIFESVLMEMKNEYVLKKKYYSHKICGLLLSIMGDIARYVSSTGSLTYAAHSKVDLILKYIHDNYDKPITNKYIGNKFNFHANYINKLMVFSTGTPLHQYLLNYRISRAIHMMQTANKTISEIAFAVGFNDVNYFSKAFKNKTGESPKHFMSHSWGPI